MSTNKKDTFDIIITPFKKSEAREFNKENRKGITVTVVIVDRIEIEIKVFQDQPTFEMLAKDIVTEENLGCINGEMEKPVFLKFGTQEGGIFMEGHVKLRMQLEKAIHLEYTLKDKAEIKGEEELFFLC
ncbi:hypothetical protein RclHR1_00460025 [Rhizophagus clarus]|uniref:Uncharacterized protein n=1 Tax=Rhizophagus clarus TaxID=94130 RepID=A0A2Z6SC08_9GLOM|nr:hypothetical protein RclHR1_00460025 [Rhizophagus clarus]GES80075.1 hypothetical protein GLOIN_2v1773103 [Rhizophagus clarus]